MTEAEVRAFYAALGDGDVDALGERLAEDVVLEFPGRRFGGSFAGRRRVLIFLRQNQRMFREGLRFTVHWVGVLGDRAVAEWSNEGVTRNGREYANRGVTVFETAGERIVAIRDFLDTERLAETWPR
jgi:ketosteroid isomerase-like protein